MISRAVLIGGRPFRLSDVLAVFGQLEFLHIQHVVLDNCMTILMENDVPKGTATNPVRNPASIPSPVPYSRPLG